MEGEAAEELSGGPGDVAGRAAGGEGAQEGGGEPAVEREVPEELERRQSPATLPGRRQPDPPEPRLQVGPDPLLDEQRPVARLLKCEDPAHPAPTRAGKWSNLPLQGLEDGGEGRARDFDLGCEGRREGPGLELDVAVQEPLHGVHALGNVPRFGCDTEQGIERGYLKGEEDGGPDVEEVGVASEVKRGAGVGEEVVEVGDEGVVEVAADDAVALAVQRLVVPQVHGPLHAPLLKLPPI